ncbi:hypothetical protein EDC04DRAFT_3142186 [Pisolithus marmoratus]|nr:hypothetical protein EDC04DRAFT_3142186 [Pisolithus marmoratus]
MTLLYGVLPDDVTMNVLKSALLSVKMDRESVRGFVTHFALQTPFRRQWPASSSVFDGSDDGKRAMVVKDIMDSLGTPVPRNIFTGMVLGNWPLVQHITAPVSAVRPPGKEGASVALILELAKSLVVRLSHKAVTTTSQNEKREYSGARSYSPVHPSPSTFLAYIKRLGLSSPSYAHEIPLALAWMPHPSIAPTRQLLSIALVFWAEVGLCGPIFEGWAENSEYGRLGNWIAEWVVGDGEGLFKDGDEDVWQTEGDIYKAIWAVAGMRDGNFGRNVALHNLQYLVLVVSL